MVFDKRNLARYSLAALITLTLTFIFVNSMLSRETSSEESEAVSGWLSSIFTESSVLGNFVLDNIRKIAHFTEFGILGSELTLYALFFTKRRERSILISQLFAFFSAFTDETIQIFSGRGPQISDVWLDFFGSLSFSLITVGIYAFCSWLSARRREDKNGKN